MIYAMIFILLLCCVYFFEVKQLNKGRQVALLLMFISLILMVSLRYRVGGDALFYENYFPFLPQLRNVVSFYLNDNYLNYQPLWILLVSISKTLINHIVFFHFVHSLLFNIALFFFLKKYTDRPFTFLLVFFSSLLFFYFSFEIQRQTMAIAVFLLSIRYLEEKRWMIYFPLSIVAYFFHVSAVILFILPLMNVLKFRMIYLYIVLGLSFVMFFFRFELLEFIKPILVNDYIKLKMQAYSEKQFSNLGFWSFFAVRVFLFLPLMLYYQKQQLHELRFRWFYPTFLIVSVLAQFFVGAERLLNFLLPVYLVLVVEFFYEHYSRIEKKTLRLFIAATVILHIFFIMNYKLFTMNEYGQRYVSVFFPYDSVFNPDINEERELFYENQW
jgi:hypothetical protein